MITAERLREVLSYDPETGEFRRRYRPGRGYCRTGEIAGNYDNCGYRIIKIDKRSYKAHRLAWLYMTGKFPDRDIDHIDGFNAHNQWENLREANDSQNHANSKPRDNMSGFKGVSWGGGSRPWMARIRVNGREIYLGRFSTPEAAHAAYMDAARKYFGEYAWDPSKNQRGERFESEMRRLECLIPELFTLTTRPIRSTEPTDLSKRWAAQRLGP
jgi:hypothetical protein